MSKFGKGVTWLRDVVQVLFLDRLHPDRKGLAQAASTACRTLRFSSRSRIRPVPLATLLGSVPSQPVPQVWLPGPASDMGNVGSHAYYHTLASLVRALQPKVILEFGTYLGVGAQTMALNTPSETRVYTVDLPDETDPNTIPELNDIDQGHIRGSRHRVGQAFLGTPQEKRITQIRADSIRFHAPDHVPAADFVLVDGGHSYPVVARDTDNAFQILEPGGAILWDDYFHLYPDVVRYLDELSERCVLQGIAGTNFVLYHDAWQKARPALGT